MPRLIALLLLFMLTTACARLRRDESGCEGMVYFNNATANASTSGARLVCSTVFINSFSVALALGRASDSSIAAGSGGAPSLSVMRGFRRLEGDGAVVELDVRFLETRFAAVRICLATFSSVKIDWMVGRGVLERISGLEKWLGLISGHLMGKVRRGGTLSDDLLEAL